MKLHLTARFDVAAQLTAMANSRMGIREQGKLPAPNQRFSQSFVLV
jgi:hypothetical protein